VTANARHQAADCKPDRRKRNRFAPFALKALLRLADFTAAEKLLFLAKLTEDVPPGLKPALILLALCVG
jgi:hypothetical protein